MNTSTDEDNGYSDNTLSSEEYCLYKHRMKQYLESLRVLGIESDIIKLPEAETTVIMKLCKEESSNNDEYVTIEIPDIGHISFMGHLPLITVYSSKETYYGFFFACIREIWDLCSAKSANISEVLSYFGN